MKSLFAAAALTVATALSAAAETCIDITEAVVFCPSGTLWDGLTWQRLSEPPSTVWETEDLALIIGEVPVEFAGGPIEIGQSALAEAIDDFSPVPEGAEELGRFAPLGSDQPATSRATHDAQRGVIEYVTLYTIGGAILLVQTVANDDRLTQDHGIRHEQALRALAEAGA
ncbi:MAG: hypothetical protein AAF748_11340 [Pseudomonadota bacterium]